jgi:hypothetical protein
MGWHQSGETSQAAALVEIAIVENEQTITNNQERQRYDNEDN